MSALALYQTIPGYVRLHQTTLDYSKSALRSHLAAFIREPTAKVFTDQFSAIISGTQAFSARTIQIQLTKVYLFRTSAHREELVCQTTTVAEGCRAIAQVVPLNLLAKFNFLPFCFSFLFLPFVFSFCWSAFAHIAFQFAQRSCSSIDGSRDSLLECLC